MPNLLPPAVMAQRLKPLMLPIAILGGALFYRWMHYITFLSPYLIFVMLTITYCRIEPRDFRFGRMQLWLLLAQIGLSAAAYFLLLGLDEVVASGVFICIFVPTATAAPVITAMLGGSLTKLATFSLVSNIAVAIIGPVVLAAIGVHPDMSFSQSFALICSRVFPLLILPIITAFILRYTFRRFHDALADHQSISFYLWSISLFIVVGGSVSYVINHYQPGHGWQMLWLAAGALVATLVSFRTGRHIGARFGDRISGGQGLGQKNTVLAVWLAIAYLNPMASVAPASYVAWQNILNSYQLMIHRRNTAQKTKHKNKLSSSNV